MQTKYQREPNITLPLTENKMKAFVRFPPKQTKVFTNKATDLPRSAQPKDNHRENKYITEQFSQFNKSRKEVLASPQPSPSNQKRSFDTSRDQSDPTPRKVQSSTSKEGLGPGISSPVHSANAKIGNSLKSSGVSNRQNFSNSANSNSTSSPEATSELRPSYSVSPEDKALLLFLLQMKYMTMEQIDRKFLKDQKSAESFRKLLSSGYIKTKDPNISPTALITPTEKAYDCLKIENQGKDLPRPTRRLFDPVINHDLKLVDLRIRFEELNFINKWFSESMLEEVPLMKRLFQDLPDAVCKKKNEKGYFLELEISQKSNKRYEERIALYEQALKNEDVKEAGIEGVIFLCTDEKVAQALKAKLPNSKAFSVLMLTRYLKNKEAAA